MNALLAALCVLPCISAMYITSDFSAYDAGYDPPDQKIFRKNAFGQIQAFDVSHEVRYAPNAYGGVSQYSVMDISDPDIYTPAMAANVGGAAGFGAMRGGAAGFGAMRGMGTSNLVQSPANVATRAATSFNFPFTNTISNFVSPGYPLQYLG